MTQSESSFAGLVTVFYDIEASALDGYPIEIGWAQVTPSLTIVSESRLIHHFGWDLRRGWSRKSEHIHRISREDVERLGHTPYQVALRMNAELEGRQLFADSAYDEHWLGMIFEAAGIDPAFTVRRLLSDILVAQFAGTKGITPTEFAALLTKADRHEPRRHRAEQDARHIAAQWLAVAGFERHRHD